MLLTLGFHPVAKRYSKWSRQSKSCRGLKVAVVASEYLAEHVLDSNQCISVLYLSPLLQFKTCKCTVICRIHTTFIVPRYNAAYLMSYLLLALAVHGSEILRNPW